MTFGGVLFDWRGTLVVAPAVEDWAAEALRRLGRPAGPDAVERVAPLLAQVADELDAPGLDADAALHRSTYRRVLTGLGFDPELVTALYEVESDPMSSAFADDVAETLRVLAAADVRIGVVSDIHVDIRPAFASAGLADVVDVSRSPSSRACTSPTPRCSPAA